MDPKPSLYLALGKSCDPCVFPIPLFIVSLVPMPPHQPYGDLAQYCKNFGAGSQKWMEFLIRITVLAMSQYGCFAAN